MQDTIFREYDIRGKVGSELVIDNMYQLAQAIAYYFLQKNPGIKIIALAMDGRTHSPEIKSQIIRAFIDAGIDIVFVGIVPSPALYFAVHTLAVDGGLMITASHNPKEYNGLKILLGKKVVWGKQIQEIKKLFYEKKCVLSNNKGIEHTQPIVQKYIDWLCEHFAHLKSIELPIVIDAGNGACGAVIPELMRCLDWKNVHLLCMEVDGTYPNHEADPTVEKNMRDVQEAVKRTGAVLGAGFDGDGDRMAAMGPDGKIISGDQLLALFANSVLAKNRGAKIIFDVKASSGLPELIETWGGVPIMSPAGHAIIKEYMLNHDGLLAGELSCHFFFKDRYFGYDDGIYALLRLVDIMVSTGKSLEELRAIFPKRMSSPEFRIACPEDKKQEAIKKIIQEFDTQQDKKVITLDGARVIFPHGWGLVRASNTQPELSIRIEASDATTVVHIMRNFIKILEPYISIHEMNNWIQKVSG